jgi:hypothetical protein
MPKSLFGRLHPLHPARYPNKLCSAPSASARIECCRLGPAAFWANPNESEGFRLVFFMFFAFMLFMRHLFFS